MNNELIEFNVTHQPVILTNREKEFIENYILGVHFPWFWQNQQTINDEETINTSIPSNIVQHLEFYNGPFLSHTLLYRTEDETISHQSRPQHEVSQYFEFFLEIFNRFMIENNLEYSKIFRANLNLSWFNGAKHTTPHLDHHWPHHNFIMYLTDCEDGQTLVWPDDFSASYMFPCQKYTAIAFKQCWHAHRYPAVGSKRLVLVVTYI